MILSPAVSSYFTTIGYEVAVVSVLALAILPRGKFLQTLMLNMAAVFLGGGLSMLVLWCGIQARLHTMADPLTPINPPPSDDPAPSMSRTRPTRLPYSSSQSAVCGVLLFFNTWLINIARAKIPSFNTPAILFSILINVAAMQGPLIGDTYQAWLLVERLAAAMLTALALGTCVSLFVFPVTSRGGVLKQFGGGVGLLRKAVRLQGEYLQGLEGEDMFALRLVETSVAGGGGGHKVQADKDKKKKKRDKLKDDEFDDDDRPLTKEEETALELKRTIVELRNLVGKVQGDMGFAKREVAWGKLDAHNLGEIYKLFRAMFIPIMGMATVMDIFRRTAKERGWTADEMEDASAELLSEKNEERKVWNGLMKRLHEPFAILSEAIDEGLEHAAVQLGILPKPKDWGRAKMERLHAVVTGSSGRSQKLCDPDVEAQRQRRPSLPGESGFGRVLEDKIQRFYSCKGETLRYWANENGLSYEQARDGKTWDLGSPATRERRQNQLYILLYMEQLVSHEPFPSEEKHKLPKQPAADTFVLSKRCWPPARQYTTLCSLPTPAWQTAQCRPPGSSTRVSAARASGFPASSTTARTRAAASSRQPPTSWIAARQRASPSTSARATAAPRGIRSTSRPPQPSNAWAIASGHSATCCRPTPAPMGCEFRVPP